MRGFDQKQGGAVYTGQTQWKGVFVPVEVHSDFLPILLVLSDLLEPHMLQTQQTLHSPHCLPNLMAALCWSRSLQAKPT